METKIEQIKSEFGGRLVGNDFMRESVAKAVSLLPLEIAEKIIDECWFFSSEDDSFGYAFNGNDLKDEHLIFLSDVLFDESESQIMYTILHEIGHIVLGHKNSIEVKQTKEEIKIQESEADLFAKKYSVH